MSMILKIGRRLSAPVTSFKQASELYSKERAESGEGASTFPFGEILDGQGLVIAEVSYNGRVWAPGATRYPPEHNKSPEPIYDNRKVPA